MTTVADRFELLDRTHLGLGSFSLAVDTKADDAPVGLWIFPAAFQGIVAGAGEWRRAPPVPRVVRLRDVVEFDRQLALVVDYVPASRGRRCFPLARVLNGKPVPFLVAERATR